MAITSIQIASFLRETFSHPDGPAKNSRITFQTGKTLPVRTALAPIRSRVLQTPFFTHFWVSKAYK
jgi:hypothetical protein